MGEGGPAIAPGGRLADFFFIFIFFSRVFSEASPVGVFFCFVWFLESLGGSLLEVFLKSMRFSRKRWYPRFCLTLQCFGVILRVRASPKAAKLRKRRVWK